MHIYESHMGGFYTSNDEIDYDDLYCDQCGDSDLYLGEAHTLKEVLGLITDDRVSAEYVKEFIDELFGVSLIMPSEEDLYSKKFVRRTDKNGREYPHCTILNDYCYECDEIDFSDAYCEMCGYNMEYEIIKVNPPEILNATID